MFEKVLQNIKNFIFEPDDETPEPAPAPRKKQRAAAAAPADPEPVSKPAVVPLGLNEPKAPAAEKDEEKEPEVKKETVSEHVPLGANETARKSPAVQRPQPVSEEKPEKKAEAQPNLAQYVFAPVISPIYGIKDQIVTDENGNKIKKAVTYTPARPAEKSSLGDVISPTNGALAEKKNDSVPRSVASLGTDDLISNDGYVVADRPDRKPVKKFEGENMSLFDEEEQ